MDLKQYIWDVPDFPRPGIVFKDITPLLNDQVAFRYVVDKIADFAREVGATVVIAPEARGFIFAGAVAYATGCRLALVRKPGKLPRPVDDVAYDLEYGNNHLQVQKGDLLAGDRVLIIDDILATGGTVEAVMELVERSQAVSAGLSVLGQLQGFDTSQVLARCPHQILLDL